MLILAPIKNYGYSMLRFLNLYMLKLRVETAMKIQFKIAALLADLD